MSNPNPFQAGATQGQNPSVRPSGESAAERRRIPMSIPRRKLEVPDLPGFHLYWMLESMLPQAQQAGYEFVDAKEVNLNQHNVATAKEISGNASLGSHISVYAGKDQNGQPEFFYLMKIRLDWYREDQRILEERNAAVLSAVFRKERILGDEGASQEDKNQMYVKEALFKRPRRRE